ncbi:hypothetical protein D3C80_1337920 [compost metagenome]
MPPLALRQTPGVKNDNRLMLNEIATYMSVYSSEGALHPENVVNNGSNACCRNASE